MGCIGALAYFDLKQIIIYNIIITGGVILFGVAQMNDGGMYGMVFYLFDDMSIKAALFILIGIMIAVTCMANIRHMSSLMESSASLGRMELMAACELIV